MTPSNLYDPVRMTPAQRRAEAAALLAPRDCTACASVARHGVPEGAPLPARPPTSAGPISAPRKAPGDHAPQERHLISMSDETYCSTLRPPRPHNSALPQFNPIERFAYCAFRSTTRCRPTVLSWAFLFVRPSVFAGFPQFRTG